MLFASLNTIKGSGTLILYPYDTKLDPFRSWEKTFFDKNLQPRVLQCATMTLRHSLCIMFVWSTLFLFFLANNLYLLLSNCHSGKAYHYNVWLDDSCLHRIPVLDLSTAYPWLQIKKEVFFLDFWKDLICCSMGLVSVCGSLCNMWKWSL